MVRDVRSLMLSIRHFLSLGGTIHGPIYKTFSFSVATKHAKKSLVVLNKSKINLIDLKDTVSCKQVY